ncbi:MAG: 50S ribosomal protein L28 [Chlamydiae bacterium SM23_39]|nr:MAG: 50S ribosomal protein L28 [Chlamydiae bacterium SM23_39]
MARKCVLTGKKPRKGRTYVTRGIAKKKKGIGLNITGKNKRRFLPNLFKKRLFLEEENRFITLKLSSSALRTIDRKGLSHFLKNIGKKKRFCSKK